MSRFRLHLFDHLRHSTAKKAFFLDRGVSGNGRADRVEGDYEYRDHWPVCSIDDHFEFTSLEECQAALFPLEYSKEDDALKDMARECARQAQAAGKAMALSYVNDDWDPVAIDGPVLVFRPSVFRSAMLPQERILPAFHEDLVHRFLGGKPHFRRKEAVPTVGFCGYSYPVSYIERNFPADFDFSRFFADVTSGHIGLVLRAYLLNRLSRADGIQTLFKVRKQFWAGVYDKGFHKNKYEIIREQYFRNLLLSDYVLCPRGKGNFSIRFYEALCMGRIPVLIDTDCALPFPDHIPWDEIIVRVPVSGLDAVAGTIAAFHHALSDNEFQARQQRARDTWLHWLSHAGFYSRFRDLF